MFSYVVTVYHNETGEVDTSETFETPKNAIVRWDELLCTPNSEYVYELSAIPLD